MHRITILICSILILLINQSVHSQKWGKVTENIQQ